MSSILVHIMYRSIYTVWINFDVFINSQEEWCITNRGRCWAVSGGGNIGIRNVATMLNQRVDVWATLWCLAERMAATESVAMMPSFFHKRSKMEHLREQSSIDGMKESHRVVLIWTSRY